MPVHRLRNSDGQAGAHTVEKANLNAFRDYQGVLQALMVSAIRGVLLQCDIPTKEFIISLNEGKPTNERFIIHDLDDTRLYVQPSVVEWLEQRLKEFNEENTYQAPRRVDMK